MPEKHKFELGIDFAIFVSLLMFRDQVRKHPNPEAELGRILTMWKYRADKQFNDAKDQWSLMDEIGKRR